MTRIALLLALVACGSDKNDNPTKSGTVVLSWKLADAERVAIRGAKQTDNKTQSFDFVSAPDYDKKLPVKVKVEIETATVTWEEDGKQVEHSAPVKITVTAVDANDFTLSNGKCLGPHYNMQLPPGRDMILHCMMDAKKPRYDVDVTFYAYGDNRIDDGIAKSVKVSP